MNFYDAKKIHFIAIGGIGVSALARLAHSKGIIISGSDISDSEIIKTLRTEYGFNITIGSNPDNITHSTDLVIYSPAIHDSDAEYRRAKTLGIPLMSYPEALGQISHIKKTIAVSGTNGKTTTTSMLVEVFKQFNIDPTVIIGGILQKYGTNFLNGGSEYFITEACEYKRSFLNISHDIAIITNITEDHLDYFSNLADIQSAFIEFINNKKGPGIIVCNMTLKNLVPIISYAKKNDIKIFDYSVYLDKKYQLLIPGEHNRQNMAAALATIEALDLDVDSAYSYLSQNFSGTKRRMEYVGETESGALIYDDYAHNPEGIKYLFDALQSHFPDKKVIALFEPHLYSRTEDFKNEFGRTLSLFESVYLFPVYKAREIHQPENDYLLEKYIQVSETSLFTVREPHLFKEHFERKKYSSDYVIVTIGAGDIWKIGLDIKKQS